MPHNRVIIRGTLAGGLENWSTGASFAASTGALPQSPEELQEWAAAIEAALPTIVGTRLQAFMSSETAITNISVYYYPTTGAPAEAVGEEPTNMVGTGAGTHPLTVAVVGTLRTARAGRSYRGRMYWPAQGGTFTPEGRISSAAALELPQEFADLLNGIAAAAPAAFEMEPAVVSQTAGAVTSVTQVAVGNVPDTQRRRRDRLEEVYEAVPI